MIIACRPWLWRDVFPVVNRVGDALRKQALDKWRTHDSAGSPAKWKVENGYMEVVRGAGDIRTAQSFRDVELHVEWMTPRPPSGEGQGRGNSGVFLMGMYEVQVLDSFENETYFDGQAGSIYKQTPPMANAMRRPSLVTTASIRTSEPVTAR